MTHSLPARFERPSVVGFVFLAALAALLIASFEKGAVSPTALIDGLPQMQDILSQLYPPDISRLPAVLLSTWVSFAMAVAGTTIGLIVSFFIAPLGSRVVAPVFVAKVVRSIFSVIRTIPDLIWALLFVASVGLGPFAGVLTLAVETIGFCGRFFAQSIDDSDEGPRQALTLIGAKPLSIYMSAILPNVRAPFLATALYSLEKATRGSVILGLVGAGGVGIELKVAMDSFRFAEASTIILVILLLVMIVEWISESLRRAVQKS